MEDGLCRGFIGFLGVSMPVQMLDDGAPNSDSSWRSWMPGHVERMQCPMAPAATDADCRMSSTSAGDLTHLRASQQKYCSPSSPQHLRGGRHPGHA